MNYKNPILYADYSDPDAVRVGEDYYMVASSFANTPALPILHSVNLVDWELINYVADRLPFDYYDFPMHGCGVWAPSIRFHDGVFYCFVPMPDEGLFVYKTKDIYGKWDEPVCLTNKAGWIDPCPFFDTDGRVYMVNGFAKSRIGFKEMLHVCELNTECTQIIDTGHFVFDGTYNQPTVEGPKLYKRNGYYYIFAPAGGVKTGWQLVLRSKNIYGPYEEKIVLKQGDTPVNGPHQGAWVDTESGEDWFLHFQDVGNGGRIVHLQPMIWKNDWPIIGNPVENQDYGVPVLEWQCPTTKVEGKIKKTGFTPLACDGRINPNWQWNANHKNDWYSIDGEVLKLYAKNFSEESKQFIEKFSGMICANAIGEDLAFSLMSDKRMLANYPNLLTLKLPSETPEMKVIFDLSEMQEDDETGIGILGDVYSALIIKRISHGIVVYKLEGERSVHSFGADPGTLKNVSGEERITFEREFDEEKGCLLEFKVTMCDFENAEYSFRFIENQDEDYAYSNEQEWIKAEGRSRVTPGRWVGAKLFAFARNKNRISEGFAKVLKLDLQ